MNMNSVDKVDRLVCLALNRGYLVGICDEEGYWMEKPQASLWPIHHVLGSCEMEHLIIARKDGSGVGVITLVWDRRDDACLIVDYSYNKAIDRLIVDVNNGDYNV